jgi:hypothetical protein
MAGADGSTVFGCLQLACQFRGAVRHDVADAAAVASSVLGCDDSQAGRAGDDFPAEVLRS